MSLNAKMFKNHERLSGKEEAMIEEGSLAALAAWLKETALAYPEAVEDHPWGDPVYKVAGKVFLFTSVTEGGLNVTVKLPRSYEFALEYPFASPARYGLARGRWAYCRFEAADDVDRELLAAWIEESWRAVAPKRLVKARGRPSP